MGDLPNAVVKRLISKTAGSLRISGSAIDLAVAATEDYLARLAKEAEAAALADRRKTIMDSDIEKARLRVG